MKGSKRVAELAVRILRFLDSLGREEAESSRPQRAVLMAMLVALYSLVMDEEVWGNRHDLFDSFGQSAWPNGVDARERIITILDGINLRSDFWTTN